MKTKLFLMLGCLGLLSTVMVLGGDNASTTQPQPEKGKTIRLLTVGNSFANNALKFLPQIVEASGNKLIVGRANLGGCSLERHWKHAAKYLADPTDKDGKPYGGKSLVEKLKQEKWDAVTIQQFSWASHDPATYEPFATNLVKLIHENAPQAEILLQQIWAYRVDDPRFAAKEKKPGQPDTHKKMYELVRKANHDLADKHKLKLLPSGDAMYMADTHETWGYKPDANWDSKTAKPGELPNQEHSLHVGWFWKTAKDGKKQLGMDGHHANRSGEYLIGCVWFEVLYDQSVVGNSFIPEGMDPKYVRFLQQTAHDAVAALKTDAAKKAEAAQKAQAPISAD